MRWPWRDLLFLHGHVVDHTLTTRRADASEEESVATPPRERLPNASLGRRGLAALRLCLGIGDGAIRTQ